VLRVFCAEDGSGGNPLGLFLDGGSIPAGERQAVAADLGFSETVFVDDSQLRIFTPAVELAFAGHPCVGAAWLLDDATELRVPAGVVSVRREGDQTFVSARPEWSPEFDWVQLASPAYVNALLKAPGGGDAVGAWAWIDEGAGTVRARMFPVRYGIAEDEATGSAAMLLCASLGGPIEVHQGRGSRISARPLADGRVEIGGSCVLDEVRDYR
jgi:predicted PhzF superfamily epimerase YddE/YHI9